MKLFQTAFAALVLASQCTAVIWDNTQQRPSVAVDTKLATSLLTKEGGKSWKTYKPDAKELSYKGRWDSKHISWWSAPGLKFGFTGEKVAISFGNYTIDKTLIAYRVGGLDWQFTNVSVSTSHLLVDSRPQATDLSKPQTFELRVTNWGYGVQIAGVHVDSKARLYKVSNFPRHIEIIGDSLSSGQYASYEGLSSWSYQTAAGFGNTEFAITAYPGICAADKNCWGNPRGQVFQWDKVQDGNWRQQEIYGLKPEKWDFKKQNPADIVIINLGTNDNNTANNVSTREFVADYTKLVENVHRQWPKAEIIIMGLWNGFGQNGETYVPGPAWIDELPQIVAKFKPKRGKEFVHFFDVTGILQHNDIGPGTWHPTDIGHLKVAAEMRMFIKQKFGWKSEATGPEVHSGTYIYNDECCY